MCNGKDQLAHFSLYRKVVQISGRKEGGGGAACWMAAPISVRQAPGRQTSTAAATASRVARASFTPASSTFPTSTVAQLSPKNPSWKVCGGWFQTTAPVILNMFASSLGRSSHIERTGSCGMKAIEKPTFVYMDTSNLHTSPSSRGRDEGIPWHTSWFTYTQ